MRFHRNCLEDEKANQYRLCSEQVYVFFYSDQISYLFGPCLFMAIERTMSKLYIYLN